MRQGYCKGCILKKWIKKMKSNRSRQFWKMIVAFLSIVCFVQGVILVTLFFNRQPSNSYFDSFDTYSSHLNQKLKNQTKDNFELFDRFFNDDFFSSNTDPFKEMARLSRELEQRMGGNNRNRLKNYWDEWTGRRFTKSDTHIAVETKEQKDAFIVTIKVPNLEANSLNIDISNNGISIDGTFYKKVERKDNKNQVIGTHEIKQTFSRQIPIPANTKAEDAEILTEKDRVIITLPKN